MNPTLQARAVFFSGPTGEFSDRWMWQGSCVRWEHWNGQAQSWWEVLAEHLGKAIVGIVSKAATHWMAWTTEVRCLIVLEARSPRARSQQDGSLLKLGGYLCYVSPSIWWFASNFWRSLAYGSCVAYLLCPLTLHSAPVGFCCCFAMSAFSMRLWYPWEPGPCFLTLHILGIWKTTTHMVGIAERSLLQFVS